jgi:hypothetical protein
VEGQGREGVDPEPGCDCQEQTSATRIEREKLARELGWISVQRSEYEPRRSTTDLDEMTEDPVDL